MTASARRAGRAPGFSRVGLDPQEKTAGLPVGRGGNSGEVRLIGGLWKRSKLPVANAPGLRPTPDRARETLFNWLGHDLSGWRCLDAFAGSGALGFEAASRGADQVVLLERDRRLVQALNESKQRLGAVQLRVESADALVWMGRCPPDSFELVFVDPPFDSELIAPALALARRLVVPQGFVYVESGRELEPPEAYRLHRRGRAGAVNFCLLQRAADE